MIAIIAILAAMLMPALQKARDRAKSISCLNNLKQNGTALTNYESDFGIVYASRFINGAEHAWNTCMSEGQYLPKSNRKLVTCPGWNIFPAPTANEKGWDIYGVASTAVCFDLATLTDSSSIPRDYNSTTKTGYRNPIKFKKVRYPSVAFLVMDSIRGRSADYGYQWFSVDKGAGAIHIRHGGMTNIAYVDGHASARSLGQVLDDMKKDFADRYARGVMADIEKRHYVVVGDAGWSGGNCIKYEYYN